MKDLSLERLHKSIEGYALMKIASRLWETKEVVSFLEVNEGSGIVEGISLRNCFGLATFQSQADRGLMGETTIQRFDRLRLLDLTWCHIEVVEFCLRKCWKELSWLCLDVMIGMVIPGSIEAIGFYTRLRVLQMRYCYCIEELPASIGNLVHLLEFDLTYCYSLRSLPHEIGHLKRLKRLQLYRCLELEEVPTCVSQLIDLEYLGLSRCVKLVSMVEFETRMDHFYELDLNGCHGLRIPFKSLGKLHQLRILDMESCKSLVIENPSESFGHLSRLEKLSLRSCYSLISGFHLKTFDGELSPQVIERLWDLTIESFSFRLQELVLPSISQVGFPTYPKLKVLGVYNGFHLQELPTSLGTFTQLECLTMHDTHPGYLKKLPNSMWGLVKLKVLHLSNFKALDRLSNKLGYLSSLTTLEINGMSRIEELPESVGQLSKLQSFSLVGCVRLKHLPNSITSLTQLLNLILKDCNELVELPTSLGQLSQLKHLDLEGCLSLKQLPESFKNLTQLSQLILDGCHALEVEDVDQKFLLQELRQRGCYISM